MLFEYINDIVNKKQGNLSLDNYSPYLVARWISFINPAAAQFINQFNTKGLLESKELHYRILVGSFPALPRVPRISYTKKINEPLATTDEQTKIRVLADTMQLSVREISFLIQENLLLTNKQ